MKPTKQWLPPLSAKPAKCRENFPSVKFLFELVVPDLSTWTGEREKSNGNDRARKPRMLAEKLGKRKLHKYI